MAKKEIVAMDIKKLIDDILYGYKFAEWSGKYRERITKLLAHIEELQKKLAHTECTRKYEFDSKWDWIFRYDKLKFRTTELETELKAAKELFEHETRCNYNTSIMEVLDKVAEGRMSKMKAMQILNKRMERIVWLEQEQKSGRLEKALRDSEKVAIGLDHKGFPCKYCIKRYNIAKQTLAESEKEKS